MYKDREKQKEANRQAQARRRQQGMTQGMTSEGMTQEIVIPTVIPNEPDPRLDKIYRDNIANLELCRTCQEPLPPLEKPRLHPGKCYSCSQKLELDLTFGAGQRIANAIVGEPVL